MALHHKIKPHHHFNSWLVASLVLVGSILTYNTAMIGTIHAEDGGPSASTKKFFGFNNDSGEGQKFVQPEICKQNPVQDQMQALQAQMQQLQQQQQTQNQPQQQAPTQQDQSQTEQQQQQALQAQQQTQQAQQQANQEKLAGLQAQMQALQSQMQNGPTDDCKKAIVQQSIDQMSAMQAKMFSDDKLTGTLAKVDAAVAKIQTQIPQLQAAGVSADDITTIQSNIATIQQDNATLRAFFNSMKTQMASFIAAAKADPLGTFGKMQHGDGPISGKDSTTASNAADGMVSAFTNLVGTLDKITATLGG